MDMTNFIRQSNNNMYDTNHGNHVNNENMNNNGTFHKSNGKPSVTFQYNVNDFAKKANSLDSINAVERELDEVLKDLEMNSADLNEQLESEYNHHHPNVVELPISIQKSVKVDSSSSSSSNSCSSPSMSLNKSNNSANSVKWSANTNNQAECVTPTNFERMKRADFIKNCELFIDDSARVQNGMPTHGNTKKTFNQNGQNNGRQNIISTYELCNECFDNTMLMSNQHDHHHHQHQGSPSVTHSQPHSKCFKNHNNGNKTSSNFRDVNNHSSGCPISPLAYAENGYGHSAENGTGMSYQSNRSRLAQINESVVPESASQLANNKQSNSSTLRKSNENHHNKSNQHNGNVISQKVISIGMPSRNGCESPSPSKHSEFKSEQSIRSLTFLRAFFFNCSLFKVRKNWTSCHQFRHRSGQPIRQ